jgi:hypothetical protein
MGEGIIEVFMLTILTKKIMTKNHSIVVFFSTFAYKNDIRNKT